MAQAITLISYDLKEVPGGHARFKKELEAMKWKFAYENKTLPNTTCWVEFKEGISLSGASNMAEIDLKKAEANVIGYNTNFKLERYYVVSFPKDESDVRLKSFV